MTDERRRHAVRVTALVDGWARALRCGAEEASAWHDAARWHDALRDAPGDELRVLAGAEQVGRPAELLHGPAAANRLAAEGEHRTDVLEAIRHHTVGCAVWSRTGRALYMADFLDPGRPFARRDRAFLADMVASDFDGVFRQVVRSRVEWTLREGKRLRHETVALWNSLQ